MNPDTSHQEIEQILNANEEWLLVIESSESFALRRGEIELERVRGQSTIGYLSGSGFVHWKILEWKNKNGSLSFLLSRDLGRKKQKIDLVPRTAATELTAALELARIERANRMANALVTNGIAHKLLRVSLSKENSRFARLQFVRLDGAESAALADVTENLSHESLLALAVRWLTQLQSRKKNPLDKVVILTNSKTAGRLAKLKAMLKPAWEKCITVIEVKGDKLKQVRSPELYRLLRKKLGAIKLLPCMGESELVQKLTSLAPNEIDPVFSRHGITLRYLGLPFVRIRKVAGEDRAWFGVESKRQALTTASEAEFHDLFENLKTYRAANSPNKRHQLYRLAPEGWLESILRRNIKMLDSNMILSPIYHQFRISADKIDLLALRRDGRLVVIELKVSPDRELAYQAIDYWRKIEAQRIAGNIQRAGIFENRNIADRPAIIYLVAPRLSYHPDFDLFARTITPEIEMHRFALNETWREDLKVTERMS